MPFLPLTWIGDIVGVEFKARLGGEGHHHDAGIGIIEAGGGAQLSHHAIRQEGGVIARDAGASPTT